VGKPVVVGPAVRPFESDFSYIGFVSQLLFPTTQSNVAPLTGSCTRRDLEAFLTICSFYYEMNNQ